VDESNARTAPLEFMDFMYSGGAASTPGANIGAGKFRAAGIGGVSLNRERFHIEGGDVRADKKCI
jgi:hypothetical protein